jgi:hypothetical protein
MLLLSQIRTDGGTQSRAGLDEDWARELASHLGDGTDLPPVIVFHDGRDHWLADGFHRARGYVLAGRTAIPADVRQGTKRDAVLYSVGANATHGLRRSNADKRRAVEVLLRDAEWGQWSNVEIAKRCGVSHTFVADVRREVQPATVAGCETRKGADGKTRKVPAPKAHRPPPPAPDPEDTEDEDEELEEDVESEPDHDEPDTYPPAPAAHVPPRNNGMSDLDVTIACVRGLNDEERAGLFRQLGVVTFEALTSLVEQRARDPEYAQMRRISEPTKNATRGMRMVVAVLDGADPALAILGCTWASTADDIRRAYREASLAAHPDRGGDQTVMSRLNWANGVVRAFLESP